jgi:hypothetical protein
MVFSVWRVFRSRRRKEALISSRTTHQDDQSLPMNGDESGGMRRTLPLSGTGAITATPRNGRSLWSAVHSAAFELGPDPPFTGPMPSASEFGYPYVGCYNVIERTDWHFLRIAVK